MKLLPLLLLLLCTNVYAQKSPKNSLELDIEGIYEYGAEGAFLVQLVEKEGTKNEAMIMVIGQCEATSLARVKYDWEFSRPLTYDLFTNVLESTSLKLEYIHITNLEEGIYYAHLVINDNGKEIKFDARPSDSINLALRSGVPIYVSEVVWQKAKEDVAE